MQSPSEIFSQINSFFVGKIRRKSSDSLTSPSPEDEDEEDSDFEVTPRPKKSSSGKVRRHSEITNGFRKDRGYKATVSRHSRNAVNFMRMAKQDIKLNLKRLSFGDNTPPALPARHFSIEGNDDLPPPIPERKCSLECFIDVEFERRFTFRPMSTCRLPEPFTDCKKTYPSKQPRRKALQRPVVEPPPPPPPQDTPSPDSPSTVFSLSSPPFRGGVGGPRKTSNQFPHQNPNGARTSQNINIRNGLEHNDLPLPPPPPDPFLKPLNGMKNGNKSGTAKTPENDMTISALYSKAQKPKLKQDALVQNNQNHDSEIKNNFNRSSGVFSRLSGSRNGVNGSEIPHLPPSLIPPPPSKALPPPPPLSAKPTNLLLRTNSNQQIITPASTKSSPKGMRNSISTPMFSTVESDDRKSSINELSNGLSVTSSSKKTQRSVSTPSPPPPLPSRNSLISMSPSIKPKPTIVEENGSGSERISGTRKGAPSKMNNTSKELDDRQLPNNSSPSELSGKLAMPSNAKPLLPPKKDSLANNSNHLSPSTRPASVAFSQATFSAYPLPPAPPSPTPKPTQMIASSLTDLPPPPPPPSISASSLSSTSLSPPSPSSSSSASSTTSPRKLSGNNKNRPLPPPPSSEDLSLKDNNYRKSLAKDKVYGEGWGGKETFDPREEDGDIYDLMESTNM